MSKGLLSVDEALAQLLAGARPVAEVEDVPTLEATGRVLARAQRLQLAGVRGRALPGSRSVLGHSGLRTS